MKFNYSIKNGSIIFSLTLVLVLSFLHVQIRADLIDIQQDGK